jgi:hypothetical protein
VEQVKLSVVLRFIKFFGLCKKLGGIIRERVYPVNVNECPKAIAATACQLPQALRIDTNNLSNVRKK